MKRNQSGFSVVEFVMAVVIVGLLGAVGWLYWANVANKSTNSKSTGTLLKSKDPTSSKPDETAIPKDWVRYSSSTYGVSFAHSPKWKVVGNVQGGPDWFVINIYAGNQTPGSTKLEDAPDAEMYVDSMSVTPLGKVIKETDDFLKNPGIQVISRTDLKLGGQSAKEFRYKQPNGSIERKYIVSANGYIYELPTILEDNSGVYDGGGISANDYEALLKSFSFEKK